MGIIRIREYPKPSEVRYAFIDGGYLRSKFYERMERAFGSDDIPDIDLDAPSGTLGAIRIFFYDCQADENSATEPQKPKQQWINRQLEAIRDADGYRLRLGTLSRSGKRDSQTGQKEVDVLLSVELLSNSYARNIREAIVLTGDLDFRPALEEVVRHGTRVHLLYDDSGVSRDLRDVVDSRKAMDFSYYYDLTSDTFQRSHPLPEIRQIEEGTTTIARGRHVGNYRAGDVVSAKLFELNEADEESYVLIAPTTEAVSAAYVFPKANESFVLDQYLPRLLGQIHCYSRWP